MAEVFFSVITRQAIRRGSFTSVKDLIAAIENFTGGWNDRCHLMHIQTILLERSQG